MLTYRKLSKKPKSFLSFTGLTAGQYNAVLHDIRGQYKRAEEARLSKKREATDGGRPLMRLTYYRMYLTY